jgi:hypothetical protein
LLCDLADGSWGISLNILNPVRHSVMPYKIFKIHLIVEYI